MEEYKNKVTVPIRINSKLAEAPASGKSIFAYDKKSRGAEDYGKLVAEVIESSPTEIKLEQVSHSIPISARVQGMMKDRIEFFD